ncbi:MAG: methyltransferase domain-containing protein [Anaerolineae bacterium]|nr:methyltransferase domain-containing protein [Anaerolineae bacterium]
MSHLVLSHYQSKVLLTARREGKPSVQVSPDLNRTMVEVSLTEEGVRFPDHRIISWPNLEQIDQSETKCFVVEEGTINGIQTFSETTRWARSLMPTAHAPTMLVSGIPMHRIQGTEPYRDTLKKIKTLAPMVGMVLDTATGLGYTAIEAARTAEEVITIEIDPASLEIARLNPWSEELFDNPKIRQIVGDVYDEVEAFADESFSRILHDPPMFSLAGDLYAGEFYAQLHRILRHRGRLFHYIGDLSSKSGQGVMRGVVRRLSEAGFSRVERRPEAFGVLAYK